MMNILPRLFEKAKKRNNSFITLSNHINMWVCVLTSSERENAASRRHYLEEAASTVSVQRVCKEADLMKFRRVFVTLQLRNISVHLAHEEVLKFIIIFAGFYEAINSYRVISSLWCSSAVL